MIPTEIDFGPRIDKSPYFEATIAAGATAFTVYNHMYMPTSYGDPKGEYWRLLTGVTMWDVAAQRQIEIAGTDAHEFLGYLSCRDLSSLEIGQARYAPMCDYEGVLINDPVVLRVDESTWWASIADSDFGLFCAAIAAERDLDVRVSALDVAPLAVQGPRAVDVMSVLLGSGVWDMSRFRYQRTSIQGNEVWVGRAGWSKQDGFEIYLINPGFGDALWTHVAGAGREFDMAPGAPNSAERIEGGLLSYRTDTGVDTDPYEAGLGRWVDLDDRDFVGRAALLDRLERLDRCTRVGILIDSGEPIRCTEPWPIHGGIGVVRAAAWSPRLETTVGVALVKKAQYRPGTDVLVVDESGHELAGRLTSFPMA